MTTRKFPRTLREAFGPNTSIEITEPDSFGWTPLKVALCVVYAAAIVTLFFVL